MIVLIVLLASVAMSSGRGLAWRVGHRQRPPRARPAAARASGEEVEATLTADLIAGRLAPVHYRKALEWLAATDRDERVWLDRSHLDR